VTPLPAQIGTPYSRIFNEATNAPFARISDESTRLRERFGPVCRRLGPVELAIVVRKYANAPPACTAIVSSGLRAMHCARNKLASTKPVEMD
jgi:hypothetical protein